MLSQLRQKKKKEAVRRLSQGVSRRVTTLGLTGTKRDVDSFKKPTQGISGGATHVPFGTRTMEEGSNTGFQVTGGIGEQEAAHSHISPLLHDNQAVPTASGLSTQPASETFGAASHHTMRELQSFGGTGSSVFGNVGKTPFGAIEGLGVSSSAAGSSDTKSSSTFEAGLTTGDFKFGLPEGSEKNAPKVFGSGSKATSSSMFSFGASNESSSIPFVATSTAFGQGPSGTLSATKNYTTFPTTSGAFSSFDSTRDEGNLPFGASESAIRTTETIKPFRTASVFGGSLTSEAPVTMGTAISAGSFSATGSSKSYDTVVSSSSSVFSSNTFGSGSGTSPTQMPFGFGKPVFSASKITESGQPFGRFGFPVTPTTLASQNPSFPTSNVHIFDSGAAVDLQMKPGQSQSQTLTNISTSNAPYMGGKPQGKVERSPEQRAGAVDISLLKGLVIKEIPEVFNKNTWIKRFYSRFGEVTRVVCNPAKRSATVTFTTHEAAEAAKRKGKTLRHGMPPVTIFWKQDRKRSNSCSLDVGRVATKRNIQKTDENEEHDEPSMLTESDLHSLPSAVTAGDRFRTLDTIDKKLRQGMKKTSDITTAKAVKGTCPDMCPEKERYMREDQRRLHAFEIIPGTGSMEENSQVDHAKAVKEYDRSAADKEEPLPHELRPTPILGMTMDYLVTNIMDIQNGHWADWYDFLWNRTRGIRKDITQQHLCDPESVDLIEKTTRFHIFCAHHLCEEEIIAFDPRINTENLTKCLQTLKQFYDDLYKTQSITCPCEAEFRAYDILMNLNEGDILRQAVQYREEVQTSAIVKFATSIFHALNSNNFVRFFRLVRSASYLCACILQRYFTQVRNKALRTMNYSLSTPNKEMSYPLKDLVEMLAFESEGEAAEFSLFYCLSVNETCVTFLRGSFIEPESKFPVRRALQLIESKRMFSIGQVVYNGPLPPPSTHQPTLNFDQESHYIGSYHRMLSSLPPPAIQTKPGPSFATDDGRVTEKGREIAQEPSLLTVTTRPTALLVAQYSIEEMKHVAKVLFLEVMNEMFVEITRDVLDKVHTYLELSDELVKDIGEEAVTQLIQDTAEIAILEEQRAEMLAAHETALKNKLITDLSTEIVYEVLSSECLSVAMEGYSSEQKELYKRRKEQATLEISQDLLEVTVTGEVRDIVRDTYRDEKARRKAALKTLHDEMVHRKTTRYFNKWLKSYLALVRLKRLLRAFPAQAPLTSNEEQLEDLLGGRADDRQVPSIRIYGEEQNISRSLERRQEELAKIRAEVLRPLDIPQLLAGASISHHAPVSGLRSSSHVDWKLVLSFADTCSPLRHSSIDVGGVHVSPVLIREKFKRGSLPRDDRISASLRRKVELLSLYRAEARTGYTRTVYRICCLACYGVPSNNEVRELMMTRQLQGTAAILLLVSSQQLQTTTGKLELQTRVRRLMQSKPVKPALPVVLLLLEDDVTRESVTDDTLLSVIGADELTSHGLVSRIRVRRVGPVLRKQALDHVLSDSVTWLRDSSGSRFDLGSDSLKNFLEEGLQRCFFTSLYEDVATRKKAKLGEQCPEAVVGLYNSTVEHLAAVVSSPNLTHVSWPVAEFSSDQHDTPSLDWNSEENLSVLGDSILSYRLPPPPPGAEDGSWESESSLCLEYVQQLPHCNCPLLRRVTWILDRKRRALEDIDFLSSPPCLNAAEVPWTRVIEACVSSVLTSLHSNPVSSDSHVYFLPDELQDFVQPLVWRDSADSSKQEWIEERQKSSIKSPVQTRNAMLQESFLMVDKEMDSIEVVPAVDGSTREAATAVDLSTVYEMQEKLGSVLLEARLEMESFDKMLHSLIHEDSSTSDATASQSKKRKAESCPQRVSPGTKSSRYVMDGMEIGFDGGYKSSIQDDLADLRQRIRKERRCEEMAGERLRAYLET